MKGLARRDGGSVRKTEAKALKAEGGGQMRCTGVSASGNADAVKNFGQRLGLEVGLMGKGGIQFLADGLGQGWRVEEAERTDARADTVGDQASK